MANVLEIQPGKEYIISFTIQSSIGLQMPDDMAKEMLFNKIGKECFYSGSQVVMSDMKKIESLPEATKEE